METQEKTTLSKNQQIKLLKEISSQLSYVLDNIKWEKIYTNYLKENIQEEKNHLRMKPEGVIHGLTAYEGGLLFAVQQIINYLTGENAPDVKSYLWMRKTVFTAYSIVTNYEKEIKEALKNIDYTEVLKMDYCDLVK
jgi:hypothetical protein